MALITGVMLRLLRAVALSNAADSSWLYVASAFVLGAVILFGMTALHLANFTLRQWTWRAPAFALCESLAEMGVSALLMLAGREPMGSGRAAIDQWWTLAGRTIINRTLAICLFALLLAGVIHVVRRVLISRAGDARSAAKLRAELLSEAPEAEIDRSPAS